MRPAVHPINAGDEPLTSSPGNRSRRSGSRAANDCTSAQDGSQKESERRYDYRRSPSLENDAGLDAVAGSAAKGFGGGSLEGPAARRAELQSVRLSLVVVPGPSVIDRSAPAARQLT